MGNVRQRGEKNSWELSYQVAGRRYWETVRCENRTQAVKILKEREGKAARHLYPQEAFRLRFEDLSADLLNDYQSSAKRSLPTVRGHLRALENFFKGKRALAITATDARAYAVERLRQGKKPSTVNRELEVLRRMFSLAAEAGRLDYQPTIPRLREDNVRRGFFEEEQFRNVQARLPGYLQPIAEFAYYTGWRRGEITSMRWDQVDLRGRVLRLWPGTTKNLEGRVLPLEGELWTLIERQRKRRRKDCPWVFHRDRRRLHSFYKAWGKACEKAKCPEMLFHDLRRTAARNLRRAGLSESEAMAITGHKTSSIFRRYAIIAESDLRDAVWRSQAFMSAEAARAEQGKESAGPGPARRRAEKTREGES